MLSRSLTRSTPRADRPALWRWLTILLVVCLGAAPVGCATTGAQPDARVEDGTSARTDDAAASSQAETLAEEDEFFDPFAQQDEGALAAQEEYDPLEGYNELVFEFNYRFDKYLVKPLAQGYDFITPDAVQRGISNAFHNLRFVPRMFNNVFQGKFTGAGVEVSRFLINTTVGVGGLFDPARDWLDLDTPDEDFGQTLGVYGIGPGAYFLIPFFPSPLTVRDAVGFAVDLGLDPFNYLVLPFVVVDDWPQVVTNEDTTLILNWALRGVETVNTRSLNLETFQGVEEAAIDLYGAVRNGYLQQRAKAIRE